MTRFATTRWSLILEARQPEAARAALDEICRAYRGPVLAYVRRRGYTPADAEDLTQDFFARFLERRWDVDANPARGRFRSFLLTALQRFLISAQVAAHAQKRGGGQQRVDLDRDFDHLPAHVDESPEQAFERVWAITVLERSFARLREETQRAGKGALFEQLSGYVAEAPDAAEYRRIGEQLGMRPNTVAVSVHRLRQRLRELVREELADTTEGEAGLQEELRALRTTLGRVTH